jgi:hypothetical protein
VAKAQLRGDYRANNSPLSLNSQLENINIPIGKPVAFCSFKMELQRGLAWGELQWSAGSTQQLSNYQLEMVISSRKSISETYCRRVRPQNHPFEPIPDTEHHC